MGPSACIGDDACPENTEDIGSSKFDFIQSGHSNCNNGLFESKSESLCHSKLKILV